jgi:hypothetical protein
MHWQIKGELRAHISGALAEIYLRKFPLQYLTNIMRENLKSHMPLGKNYPPIKPWQKFILKTFLQWYPTRFWQISWEKCYTLCQELPFL